VAPVRSLSFHAQYRCRHAGACCSSNWPIPIEPDRLIHLRRAVADGRLRPEAGAAVEAAPSLLARVNGCCVFFDDEQPDDSLAPAPGRCRIHAALGQDALPLACRQFPRVTVEDPRGVSVTLSHYCPTAAGLLELDDPEPFQVMVDPPAFPAAREYVGLDARHTLPPLLRRDMLMDWDAWWECERLAVQTCAESPDSDTALARLRGAVAAIERWSPSDGSLLGRVRDAFRSGVQGPPEIPASALVRAVLDAIPADIKPEPPSPSSPPPDSVLRRLVAAHAFASWHIYQGTGLRTWLRGVEAAAALVAAGCTIRETDLRLRHLPDPFDLGNRLAMLR
jgi:Fe-S-cluster containining protein